MDGAEVIGNLGNHVSDLLFIGYIAQIGPGFNAMCLARGYRLFELLGIEVNQRELGTLGGEVLGHRAAQTLASTSDNDNLVV
ncbi:hypothetical protein D3C80_1473220 [compost metagenome]